MKATGFLGSHLSTIVCGSLNSRSESLSAKAPQVLISGQAGALLTTSLFCPFFLGHTVCLTFCIFWPCHRKESDTTERLK